MCERAFTRVKGKILKLFVGGLAPSLSIPFYNSNIFSCFGYILQLVPFFKKLGKFEHWCHDKVGLVFVRVACQATPRFCSASAASHIVASESTGKHVLT